MGKQENTLKLINQAHQEALVLEGMLNRSIMDLRQQNDRSERLLEAFQGTLAYVLGQVSRIGAEKTLEQMLEDLEKEEAKARRRKTWKR